MPLYLAFWKMCAKIDLALILNGVYSYICFTKTSTSVSFEDRDILSAVIEENISPNNFSKSFHKLPKKWKIKSEMGG